MNMNIHICKTGRHIYIYIYITFYIYIYIYILPAALTTGIGRGAPEHMFMPRECQFSLGNQEMCALRRMSIKHVNRQSI